MGRTTCWSIINALGCVNKGEFFFALTVTCWLIPADIGDLAWKLWWDMGLITWVMSMRIDSLWDILRPRWLSDPTFSLSLRYTWTPDINIVVEIFSLSCHTLRKWSWRKQLDETAKCWDEHLKNLIKLDD